MNSSKSQGMSTLSLHRLSKAEEEADGGLGLDARIIISCSSAGAPAPDPSTTTSDSFADPAAAPRTEAFPALVPAPIDVAFGVAVAPRTDGGRPAPSGGRPILKESRVHG